MFSIRLSTSSSSLLVSVMREIGSFRSSRAKLEWARRQYDVLAREISEILEKHNDKPGIHVDLTTGQTVVEGQTRAEVPDLLVVQIGRIIGALRSSLDNLVVEATLMASPEANTRKVVFPISSNQEMPGTDKWMGEKVSGLSEEHRRIIVDLKPYKGGHPYLLVLHQLRNQDEHLQVVVTAVTSANVFTTKTVHTPMIRKGANGENELHIETTNYPAQHEVRTVVEFDEIVGILDRDVLKTIGNFLFTVGQIIAKFESAR